MSPTTARARSGGRAPPARGAAAPRRARSGPRFLRRRAVWVGLAALAAAAIVVGLGPLNDAVREITLPLRHEDIIRQQAREKKVDPALIAAIIYQESKFRDRTSHAGARGLMQITPSTADFIAKRSGGTAFTQEDLATPQVNISYGTYYLRYLIDRYDGDLTLAVAAYNAGETNVNKWIREAGGVDHFEESDIPFPETRGYVDSVRDHRKDYREHYAKELGLE